MKRARKDIGESLIEVLLTIVIMSFTITALVSSLATVSNAGTSQRNSVKADVVMRSYAEATKAAAQSCVAGNSYTVVYPSSLPAGFHVAGADGVCPPVSSTKDLTLTVTGPSGLLATMQIKVRTP